MTSEVATLRVIAARTTIPVPEVYDFDAKATDAFGYRYILMQALPGRQMDARLSRTVPRANWDKITEQLADYTFQLSRLEFESVGRLWCGSSGDEPPSIIAGLDFGKTYQTSLEYFYAVAYKSPSMGPGRAPRRRRMGNRFMDT
ncbi:MAG: hypothetical protein M4579_000274 [Chaenotheca gracillima]|nr:MAG: hypothetical protein M4579_000274 [Chaenotheca gracillima]